MFNIYLDDSGTSPSQRIAICSALVIPAKRLKALENEWENLKAKEGFTEFHSSECLARNPKSDFFQWDDEKVARVFLRVAQIATKYSTRAVSWAVKKSDYDETLPEEWRRYGGRFHYTWAFRRVLYLIRDSLPNFEAMVSPEYVFDWIDDASAKEEVERVMAQEDSGHPGEYEGRYTFKKRKEIPALQCVDLLAWSCFQISRRTFESTPIDPIAQTALDHFARYRRGEWIRLFTNTREQLQEIVRENRRDINREASRREWYRRYEARLIEKRPRSQRRLR